MFEFKNFRYKKFFLGIIIFLILFSWINIGLGQERTCPRGSTLVDGRCVRALEIVYPRIAGQELTIERVVREGLPGYINYIFTFAVAIIGLIIFGVLIYNGFLFLTSAGNPEKMKGAKDGIFHAFLGALILLASGIIFNAINPQLKIMELPEVDPLEQIVLSGIYVCTYNVNNETEFNIEEVLRNYTEGEDEIQIKAAENLRKIMHLDERRVCMRVNSSGNFGNFQVTNNNTIFAVPRISQDPETRARILEYEFGIVLHERDGFRNRCHLVETMAGERKIYGKRVVPGEGESGQIKNFFANLPPEFGIARSFTLFRKPFEPIEGRGAILFKDFAYEGGGISFLPEADVRRVTNANLIEEGLVDEELNNNIRSIRFEPLHSYFALVYQSDNFTGEHCNRLDRNSPNIVDGLHRRLRQGNLRDTLNRIGHWLFVDMTTAPEETTQTATFQSMKIIKGTVQ